MSERHFHSGEHHVLYDDSAADPTPDPEAMCIDGCGDEGTRRCGSCGRPLCGMHHEMGGGFCSDFTQQNGRPGCTVGEEFQVATHLERAEEEMADG